MRVPGGSHVALWDEALQSNTPANAFQGSGYNVTWAQDSRFGSVLQCNQTAESRVEIPGVTYGQNGSWALAVWVKWNVGSGDALEYILSQNNSENSNAALSPDTVALYLPEQENPSYGVVRALVNDGADRQGNSSVPLYLDSNGCVSQIDCGNGNNVSLIQSNDSWHLVGVTTLPEGGAGFQLFIDGQLSGEMLDSAAPFTDYLGGVHAAAHGGDAMNMTGDLVLCARSDLDASRFFTGQLVDLMLWNRSLTADDWAALYAASDSTPATEPASNASSADADASADAFPAAGIYFPLRDESLAAAGGAAPEGRGSDITWITDPVFGRVVHCDRAANSSVALPGVSYGQNGSWALAAWVKWYGGEGAGLEFALSQNNSANSNPALSPDTVAIYMPQSENPSYGVVRAIVHDSDDRQGNSSVPLYLDSNGCVSQINCTDSNGLALFNSSAPQWHLLGLTTPANGSRGYDMYIDGSLVASVGELAYTDYMGGLHSVNGGDAMNMTGDLTLCARSDLEASRFFTGDVTQLRVWNQSLSAAQFAALYQQTAAPAADAASASYPPVMAYFPLQDGDLSSALPYGTYEGAGAGVTFVDDDGFGAAVLQCNSSRNSSVAIPGVSYGQNGSWALAVWAKWGSELGESVEYILSQNNSENANAALSPDTVAIGLPEMDNPSYGVVRAIVHDSNDRQGNSSVPLYLDSNGCVSDINCLNEKNMTLFTGTPQWHLVGLTTYPDGGRGYQMYIDGQLSAEMEAVPYTDYMGGLHSVNGGDAMNLTGDLVLCARSDLAAGRFFTGRLAQLMVWNRSLAADDWAALYAAGSAYIAASPSPALASPPAAEPARTGAAVALINGQPVCALNGTVAGVNSLSACYDGYVCAPLTREQLAQELPQLRNATEGALGVCAYAPYGYLLPSPALVPVPEAFYPLGAQTLQSFPLPTYAGVNSGAKVVTDPVFGAAVSCLGNQSDLIGLATPNYTATGPFTVNIWARMGNLSGDSMAYLFSQVGAQSGASNTGWDANQVQLYVPEEGHQAYGVVRAYARDANDTYAGVQSQVWLDSDGNVSDNQARSAVSPALDGLWHMLTVSSIPGGGKGFRLFVDGSLVNEIKGNETFMSDSGYVAAATAGLPMNLNPTAVLCTRADGPSERQFDGALAYLGLYDVALSEAQVGYLARARPVEEIDIISTPTSGANASQATTSGNVCAFPALYQGTVINACVRINDGLYCPVSNGNWEQCVDNATEAGDVPAVETTARTTGEVVTDCVEYGGVPVCLTSSGYWETCRIMEGLGGERIVRSASGDQCSLPLSYRGVTVENCVGISSDYWCWDAAAAGWMACGDETFAEPSGAVGDAGVEVVLVPTVPRLQRWTVAGDMCLLPYVVDGEIMDDCVMREGNLSCINASGAWATCANASAADADAAPLVANRTTTDGDACLLPAVVNGFLFFDCTQYISEAESAYLCPVANGSWGTCAPAPASAPVPLSADDALARIVPGRRGQLCALDAGSENRACESALSCLPFPNLNVSALEPLGYCQTTPGGGLFNLESQNDTVFGQVPRCQKAYLNAIDLETGAIGGADGAFAINLWMRRPPGSNTTGTGYQYLFSRGAHATAAAATANSINIYLPEDNHTAAGLVRVMALDGNDQGGSTAYYLDSDGHVNDPNARNASSRHPNLSDGNWHMITLSTHPNRTRGYALYLDGQLAASMWDGMTDSQNKTIEATGGDAITSSDTITLCGRYDKIASRYYDGQLANLMVWSAPLGDGEVQQLYRAYTSAGPSPDAPVTAAGQESQFASPPSGGSGGLSGGAIAGIVIGALAGAGILVMATLLLLKRRRGAHTFERYKEEGGPPPPTQDLPAFLPGTGAKQLEAEMSSQASSIKDSGRTTPPDYNSAMAANPFTVTPERPSSMTSQASGASGVNIQTGRRGIGGFRRAPATVILPENGFSNEV
ncbi:hypothetical protein QBZ16_000138 [Prototheca wickerhamii]|uniref:Uncharacterized protein n=1 Tax=Prototheca wickerhamii TaxID=3111 RepID=A0AAD9INQ3_PROWI|nr:hypothetical protein QBZ16_000138 [Prototheca wickerhamii]